MLFRILAISVGLSVVAMAQPQPAGPLPGLIDTCQRKTRALRKALAECRAEGHDIAVPDAALAIAELFCQFSREDAHQSDMYDAALRSMRYVDQLLDETLQEADEVRGGRLDWPAVPQWNTVGVTRREGGFWKDGNPVFLTGMNWDASIIDRDPQLARRLGINLGDSSLRGTMGRDGALNLGEFTDQHGPYLARVGESGFPVDCLLDVSPPQWMVESTPGLVRPGYGHYDNHVFEHPRAVDYRKELLAALIPLAAQHPGLFAIDLANEPAYQQPSELMMQNWRTWLMHRYGNVGALNTAWGVQLESTDDVVTYPSAAPDATGPWARAEIDFSVPGIRGAHYDWCAFNNERVSGYLRSIAEQITLYAPDVAVHVKVMMGLYFTGSAEERGWPMRLTYHTFGVDPEAIAEFADLLGCDLSLTDTSSDAELNRFRGSVPYVIDWLNAGMSADFLKSLAPDKPFYNSEFHAVEQVDATDIEASARDHVGTALWLASLHGMSASLLWYWGRDNEGNVKGHGRTWFKDSLLQQPWALQSYCQEALRMRRFVGPIMAFSREPRRVRLLYSEPSAIQDVHYMDCLRDVYEALNFCGVPIGFVTERQLKRDIPADTRLLIVPNAQYVADETIAALSGACVTGLPVRVVGADSLTLTPTGRKRAVQALSGHPVTPLGTPQEYHAVLNRWLGEAGVQRELIALGTDGQPAWGIETRTARHGTDRLVYLVNEMREQVTLQLKWQDDDGRLSDWRTGQPVGRRITLRPRQVVFGSY